VKNSFGIIFLRLRWPNLFITLLTLFVSYFFLLLPINDLYGFESRLDISGFILLSISTVFIMAGGYIINDWMDVESDAINHKAAGVRMIPRKILVLYYTSFSMIGLLSATYLCFELNDYSLLSIQIVAVLLLLLYSTNLKSTPLAGNLLIAGLCGIIPLLPLIYDSSSFLAQYDSRYLMLNFLSLFAFMATLIREMIKDMEDEVGDRQTGLATFPVIFGMEASRWTAFVFSLLFLLILTAVLYLLASRDIYSLLYLIVFTVVPMILITFQITRSESKDDYHQISTWLKYLMLAGILFPVVYYFSYL
jgi:4-hydroxybenzoate polyprenyltransferase